MIQQEKCVHLLLTPFGKWSNFPAFFRAFLVQPCKNPVINLRQLLYLQGVNSKIQSRAWYQYNEGTHSLEEVPVLFRLLTSLYHLTPSKVLINWTNSSAFRSTSSESVS